MNIEVEAETGGFGGSPPQSIQGHLHVQTHPTREPSGIEVGNMSMSGEPGDQGTSSTWLSAPLLSPDGENFFSLNDDSNTSKSVCRNHHRRVSQGKSSRLRRRSITTSLIPLGDGPGQKADPRIQPVGDMNGTIPHQS